MLLKKKYLLSLVSIIALSCSSTAPSRFSSVDIPEDIFGIVHAGRTNTHEEYLFLDELGAKWQLNTFYWGSIEREKGHFDFSGYDTYVDTAKQEGRKIVVVLGYEIPWLFPDGKQKRYISPENTPHYLHFVEETVRHFRGRIDAWAIWNEPNFLNWKGPKKDFFEFSRLAAIKIRETDPNAYILGGSFTRAPRGFIKAMHKAGAMENLDGLSFHPYALNPSGSIRICDNFLDIMSEINFTGDTWITEVGYPTGGWYPTRVSLKKFPAYVVKTLAGAAIRKPKAVLWYHLFDWKNDGEISRFSNSSECFFGLAYPNHQRKDAAWAYQLCAAYLPGSVYTGDYPIRERIPKNIVSLCFLKNPSGDNTLILWNNGVGRQKIMLNLPDPAFIHTISTGEKTPLKTETVLDIGSTPLFITWQGDTMPRLSRQK